MKRRVLPTAQWLPRGYILPTTVGELSEQPSSKGSTARRRKTGHSGLHLREKQAHTPPMFLELNVRSEQRPSSGAEFQLCLTLLNRHHSLAYCWGRGTAGGLRLQWLNCWSSSWKWLNAPSDPAVRQRGSIKAARQQRRGESGSDTWLSILCNYYSLVFVSGCGHFTMIDEIRSRFHFGDWLRKWLVRNKRRRKKPANITGKKHNWFFTCRQYRISHNTCISASADRFRPCVLQKHKIVF